MARIVSTSERASAALTIRVGRAQIEVQRGFDQALLQEVLEVLGAAS
jgi:hypothetical protein